jgi:hypothetical protein
LLSFDEREQVVLSIDFGKTTTKIALSHLETNKDIEYFRKQDECYGSKIVVCENGDVSVLGDCDGKIDDKTLSFSSIYSFIESENTWTVDNQKWNKIDLLAATLEEIKDFILSKVSNTKIIRTVICIDTAKAIKYKKLFERAAEISGLKPVEIYSHSIAVFRHLFNRLDDGKYLHLDYGNTSLNIYEAILESEIISIENVSEIKADHVDIDDQLANFIHRKVLKETNQKIDQKNISIEGLKSLDNNIKNIKEVLQKRPSVEINLTNYGDVIGFKSVIFYDDIKYIYENKYNQILSEIKEFLKENAYKSIVISGGSVDKDLISYLKENIDKEIIYDLEKTKWLATLGCLKLDLDTGFYVTRNSYNLLLSDQTHFEIISKHTPIEDADELIYLSLVEDATHAQIVLISNGSKEVITVPSYGFLQETINFEIFFDKDYKLTIKAGSDKLPLDKHIEKIFTDIDLSYNYNLSGDQNE